MVRAKRAEAASPGKGEEVQGEREKHEAMLGCPAPPGRRHTDPLPLLRSEKGYWMLVRGDQPSRSVNGKAVT